MNLDELKSAWKCQDKSGYSNLSPEELLKRLQATQKHHGRVLLGADVFVAAVLISCTAFFLFSNSGMEIVWPLYVGSALILGAAAFHPWRNHLRRKRERRFGDSLRDQLQKRSGQLDYQIRFSRWSSLWGYYLPIITGLCLLYWQSCLNGLMPLDQFQERVLMHIVVLGLMGYFAGGLGLAAACKEKAEVDAELAALDFPVTNYGIPAAHRIARIILVVCVAALCGYLLFSIFNPPPQTGSTAEPAVPGRGAHGTHPVRAHHTTFTALTDPPERSLTST